MHLHICVYVYLEGQARVKAGGSPVADVLPSSRLRVVLVKIAEATILLECSVL